MNMVHKKCLYKGFIVILVLTNFIQINKINHFKKETKENDNYFKYALTTICSGIEILESGNYDDLVGVATLASSVGEASSLYRLTSYYKENKLLYSVLQTLNGNISNRTNIKDVIAQNDLAVLIPVIEKVRENPLDNEVSEELLYLVRKHTVIGSTLP